MLTLITVAITALATSPSETFMREGDVGSALEAAGREAKAAPQDIAAQERLIDLYLTLGLPDRAVEMFGARVETTPADPDAHYLLGRAAPGLEAARVAYEHALKLDPLHARSHMGMGAIYTATGDLAAAGAAYSRAVRIDPTLAEGWLGLSRSHIARNDPTTALAIARRAVEALPNHPDAYLTIAVLDPENAVETLQQGAARAGGDARVHAALADMLVARGEGAAARKAAEDALAVDATEPVALRVRLFARAMEAGALDEAGYAELLRARATNDLAAMDRLVQTYPNTVVTWLARSQLRLNTGDAEGALGDLRQAQKLAPDEVEVLGQLGIVLAERGEHAEAADLLERASRQRPWDASLGMGAGASASKAGQHPRAIELLSALSKQLPYSTDVSIALADALLSSGDPQRAYQVVLAASERKMDERILIALVASAAQAKRFTEAAEILERIGQQSNNPTALQLAARLREKAD